MLCLKQARHHRRQVRTFHTERNAARANTAHTAHTGAATGGQLMGTAAHMTLTCV